MIAHDAPDAEPVDATACRRLWCDVFLACITDAWNDPRDRWVGTRDFYAVAALAGLDHDVAQELAAALRARHARLRADADDTAQPRHLPVGILRGGGRQISGAALTPDRRAARAS